MEFDIPQRPDILEGARMAYEAHGDLRRRRARNRDYYRSKPRETMEHPDTGQMVYEDDAIREQGRIPIHINQIRTIVGNLKGQYRGIKTQRMAYGRNREDNEAGEQMTEALRCVNDFNETTELDADSVEEMLIAGLYGWKTTYKWLPQFNREDVYVQNIDINRFFFNPDIGDRRGHDIRIIGELHDVEIDDIIAQFAKSPEDEEKLKDLCKFNKSYINNYQSYVVGFPSRDTMNFFDTNDLRRNRIVEVWKLEFLWMNFLHDPVTGSCDVSDIDESQLQQLNLMRQQEAMRLGMPVPPPIRSFPKYEPIWKVYFLTPTAHVLWEGQTPYWHENNPYTLGFAEFLDGEIWGPVEDLLDPQRLINRITSAIDNMFGSSAKGVLLIPDECIPDDMDVNDFAKEWVKFNGVMRYKWKPGGLKPEQIVAKAIPEGIFNWLMSLKKDMQDASGVRDANLGQTPPSSTPASLYMQQIEQGQTTNRDYFDSFFAVRRRRDLKAVQLIAQYYDTVRNVAVMGKRADGSKFVTYDPHKVRGIEWDLIVSESADTPATRQLAEDLLTRFLDTNRITFRQYLQLSSHPRADIIASVIERTNPMLMDEKMSPEAYQQLVMQTQQGAQAGDPDAIALLEQAR